MRFLSALMPTLMAVAAVLSVKTAIAQTSELDNEAKVTNEQIALSKNIPATLVVRTNEATGEVQVLHANAKLKADIGSLGAVDTSSFSKAAAPTAGGSELDHDSSSSSWYFCFNRGYSYPAYYYGGYNYSYSWYGGYNYGGWNYSYYRWSYGWWY